ncbi:MAG: glycosyltransferase family 4 protein [Synechocystis sp.]|nr:glycosyltransferase family 4 protein [Synechocystis sp.]
MPMKILLVATPVGTLQSGQVGGVGLNICNIAKELLKRGHELTLLAPQGSKVEGLPIEEVTGALQTSAPKQARDAAIVIPPNAVIANLWDRAFTLQNHHHIIVNFAYDWLPLYIAPLFTTPVLHYVNMSSWLVAMEDVIDRVARYKPGTLGVHTRAQAETFPHPDIFRILGGGIEVDRYQFQREAGADLAWAGRISPEKGLEDAIAAAEMTGKRLQIFGYIQDQDYWESLQNRYPQAQLVYQGFLPTEKFQQALGQCQALLMTHKWVEALGRVALESLSCGVPIIAYCRGGPGEIVQDGVSGFLVEPDSIAGLTMAIANLDKLDRHLCRHRAETEYSLAALGDRLEGWFKDVLEQNS